jgi:hypothetical protein
MVNGPANSLTDAGPRLNLSIIPRRPGSASAWNTRSSGADWLSIHFSIISGPDSNACSLFPLTIALADSAIGTPPVYAAARRR